MSTARHIEAAKRRTGRRILAEVTDSIWAQLHVLSDHELRLLRKQLRRLTQTNCGWDAYEIRQMLTYAVTGLLKTRYREKRKKVL